MSFKATLIKGKTFNCGKYTFNASEPDRKSQIVEEEFALLLAKNEKFEIESIKESEIIKSEIKSEAIDTKEPNIFVLIDWIEEATGYGNIAKKLLNKYSGTIKYVQKGPEFKDNLDLKDVPHESYVIQLTTPNCFRDLSNVKKRIGFTMFETTKIPPDWPKICNKTCDLLIVPSEENKKVFKNCGVKVPIEVIPLWVDNTYKYYDRPKRKTFTFLFVGGVDDHNRKGWYELQKAFKQEFKNEKDVRLIFKCLFINIHNEMALQIMEDDRIKFVKGKLKNKELNKLYKKADCFVFASHGEGFGLPPLEAMATGLPTIVTDWMGCKEFVDNKICYPLKVDKLEEALYPDTYGDVGDWAYISVKGLRKQMRYVYENREEAKQKGKLAAKVVNEKFRFKHFNYKLEDIVSNMEDGNHIVSQRFLKNVKKTDRQISIIIPSFGREDLTKLCIKAIQKDDYFEKEIIVIDDGYGIDFKDNSVRCIKHETNKGFSTSVNTGIKASKFEYIFIINNDVFVYKDCFKEMFFALKNHADIVGAKLFYPDGTIQHAGVRYLGNYLFYHNFWYKTKGGDDPLYCPVTGALMGIKKKVFNKMGYFDEKFFISCEDMDFCFRAMRAGLKVLYWPKAKAIHLEGATRGNGHESKTLGNPIAYKKEVETMEYFKTLYTETEVVELCKPYQF